MVEQSWHRIIPSEGHGPPVALGGGQRRKPGGPSSWRPRALCEPPRRLSFPRPSRALPSISQGLRRCQRHRAAPGAAHLRGRRIVLVKKMLDPSRRSQVPPSVALRAMEGRRSRFQVTATTTGRRTCGRFLPLPSSQITSTAAAPATASPARPPTMVAVPLAPPGGSNRPPTISPATKPASGSP